MGVQDQKKLIRATREAVSVFLLIKEMWRWSVERERKSVVAMSWTLWSETTKTSRISRSRFVSPKVTTKASRRSSDVGPAASTTHFKHHSFKYVPNERPMTTRGKECPYVPDEKWAMCPSCGDSLSRLGIVKGCALPHHQK